MSIKQTSLLVPFCLYQRDNMSGPFQSYIGNPVLETDGDKLRMVCSEPNRAFEGWYPTGRFYAINPMFTAIPTFMKLICAKKSGVAEKHYSTLKVVNNYDPYNISDSCIYFITWTQPVPYTTPLFIYNSQGAVLATFERREDMAEAFMSPLYVLTDRPYPTSLIPPGGQWFRMKGERAEFTFRDYQGRCIPDPNGVPFLQCNLNNDLSLTGPQSLLSILDSQKRDEQSFPRFFDSISNVWISIALGVVFITLGVVLFLIFQNDSRVGRNKKR